ncbi:hypothetical protein [Catellatospora tritici]|uniref:hypothetical protein n=1 Tax=Catellatospora tritici TaxID=2851566 RepID=UPI001C2D6921|nr:hypothetical protein [Catellatospora tritici]MBV1851899.1 hypothetical protein [Catellatospora tritici]
MLHIDDPTPGQVLMIRADRSARRWHVAMFIAVVTTGAELGCWLGGAPWWLLAGLAAVAAPGILAAAILHRLYMADVARVEEFFDPAGTDDTGK